LRTHGKIDFIESSALVKVDSISHPSVCFAIIAMLGIHLPATRKMLLGCNSRVHLYIRAHRNLGSSAANARCAKPSDITVRSDLM
jgi:hypothetical protein